MTLLAAFAFSINISFFIAGSAIGRSARNGVVTTRQPLATILCALWASLEGLAYFRGVANGRRLDIGYVIDQYQRFIVPLASILGILTSRIFPSGRGSPGERSPGKARTAMYAAVGALAGAAASAAPLGMDFGARSEFVLAAWDATGFAVLAASAAACARWIRDAATGRSGRCGRAAGSLALLAILAVELVPRLRVDALPFYPWTAFIPGAWGAARLGAAAIERRSGADTRQSASALAKPTPNWRADGPLTPRELEVARAAAAGLRNVEIAERLFISLATVKKHLSNAMEKLDCRNRVELAAALRDGINPSATGRADDSRRSSNHGG